jgi:hypothetical protein
MKTTCFAIWLYLWTWTGLVAQSDKPCQLTGRNSYYQFNFPGTDTQFDTENRKNFEVALVKLVRAHRIDIISYVTNGIGKKTPEKVAYERAQGVMDILKTEGYPGAVIRTFVMTCPVNYCTDIEIRTCPYFKLPPVVNLPDTTVIHGSGLGFVISPAIAKAVPLWQVKFFPDSTGISAYIDHQQIYWEQVLRFHLEVPDNRLEDVQKVMIPLVQNARQKDLTLAKYDVENQVWIGLQPSVKITHDHATWLSAPLQGSGLYALQYKVKKTVQRIGLAAPSGYGFVAGQWCTTQPNKVWNANISLDQGHMDIVGIDLDMAREWNIQLADPLGRQFLVSADTFQPRLLDALSENTSKEGATLRLHRNDIIPLNP